MACCFKTPQLNIRITQQHTPDIMSLSAAACAAVSCVAVAVRSHPWLPGGRAACHGCLAASPGSICSRLSAPREEEEDDKERREGGKGGGRRAEGGERSVTRQPAPFSLRLEVDLSCWRRVDGASSSAQRVPLMLYVIERGKHHQWSQWFNAFGVGGGGWGSLFALAHSGANPHGGNIAGDGGGGFPRGPS